MASIRTAAPTLLLVLAGCVSGPDHEPPEMPLPPNFSEGRPKAGGDITASQWWTAFGDSKLLLRLERFDLDFSSGPAKGVDIKPVLT